MLSSPGYFRVSRYFVFATLLILCIRLYVQHHPTFTQDAYVDILREFQDEKKLFIADYLEAGEVGGELDGREIAKLCQGRRWHPEEKALIVSCEPIPGGLGEVKNGALNCVRFAIEIGAQLILPRIALRSISDISKLRGAQQSKGNPLDYMFSIPKLVSALETHCPQLKIHESLDVLYDRPSLLKPVDVNIHQYALLFHSYDGIPTTVVAETHKISEFVTKSMDSQLPLGKRHYPVRVHLQNTLFTWPLREVGNDRLRAEFGKLLRIRDDIRALAASALYNLAKRHSLAIPHPTEKGVMQSLIDTTVTDDIDTNFKYDINRGRSEHKSGGSSTSPLTVNNKVAEIDDDESKYDVKGFIGVHLRTEKDARDSNGVFPGYNDQVAYYFAYLTALAHSASSSSTSPAPELVPLHPTNPNVNNNHNPNSNPNHNPDPKIDTNINANVNSPGHIHNTRNNKNINNNNNNNHNQNGISHNINHRPQMNNIVYLATGLTASDSDVQHFRNRAALINATVLLKRDLLDASEINVLNRLTWDQRALVDYEMLLRAETVLGIVESSFAWNVALRRAQVYGGGGDGGNNDWTEQDGTENGDTSNDDRAAFTAKPGITTDPVTGLADPLIMWRDRWSWLFGKVDRAVSMYLATWP
ncbi:hypothetical protein BD289DRAFT_449440 [Coniella lustricola]|uniref:GDP-fucose protein O-fucosyltransferase-domain-containing protein n=1 Tax=Coniella lustricola TaxID=2025994 RepID=A0A2T3AMN8_9PEZI|nr:hypothetical protein BD289DRAFT_449440 [Coniella lustricola]